MGVMQGGGGTLLGSSAAEPLLPAAGGNSAGRPRWFLQSRSGPWLFRWLPGSNCLLEVVSFVMDAMIPARVDNTEAPRIGQLIQKLRDLVIVVLCSLFFTLPIYVYLVVRGVAAFITTQRPACQGPLRVWLTGLMLLNLIWPVCMPSVTLLLLTWCLGALLLIREQNYHCSELQEFLNEATVLTLLQAVLFGIAAFALYTAHPVIRQIDELLNRPGTHPEVLNLISIVQRHDIPSTEDCVICLTGKEECMACWRQLACGHRFHEDCVFEWLGKSRRCPVCRLNLHEAYRWSPSTDVADEVQMQASEV